jgi:hypothetical protein
MVGALHTANNSARDAMAGLMPPSVSTQSQSLLRAPSCRQSGHGTRCANDSIVRLKIAWDEIDLRQKIKDSGGRWSKSTKTWKIPYKTAKKAGLVSRILVEER